MGTKDVTWPDYKRLVKDHEWLPGDTLVGWDQNYRTEHVKFTVTEPKGIYVVGLTDEGEEVRFMPGCVERWHDDEEIFLARANLLASGYAWTARREWGEEYSLWWNEAHGHGQYGGSEERPPGGLVDKYGHDGPPCEECGVCLERFSGKLCFYCNFWTEYIGDPKGIVVNGSHYKDGGRSAQCNSSLLGFSGREFKVRMFDGREFSTNNMWFQGEIPERFKSRIPDNAEFVR